MQCTFHCYCEFFIVFLSDFNIFEKFSSLEMALDKVSENNGDISRGVAVCYSSRGEGMHSHFHDSHGWFIELNQL